MLQPNLDPGWRRAVKGARRMRTRRRLPSTFWQSVALLAVPLITLVGLQIYDDASLLPDLARSQYWITHTFEVMETARALDQSIQDAERSQRGYRSEERRVGKECRSRW